MVGSTGNLPSKNYGKRRKTYRNTSLVTAEVRILLWRCMKDAVYLLGARIKHMRERNERIGEVLGPGKGDSTQ